MSAHFDTHTHSGEELFYLQDSRGYVGNDVLWWAKDGHGYTTDVSKAHVFTRKEAQQHHNNRATDLPWPKSYIDAKTRPAVDMQYLERRVIERAGIVMRKEKPTRYHEPSNQCVGCGRFIDEEGRLLGCPHCGADNRP